MAVTKQDPKIDDKGNPIIKVLERDTVTGYPKKVVVKDQQQKGIEITKVRLKGGKWRIYTPKNTVDARQVILAVKEEYANFNREGVYEIQLRNMQYKLMERPELRLGYLTNPYQRLSEILTDARNGIYKAEPGEPANKYVIPFHWIVDLKRRTPEPRPWRTPQQYADWMMERCIKGWVNAYPKRLWYRQDECYIEIWVEKDTMVLLLEQLVTNVLGPNMIPVNSVSGFDSTSHLRRQRNRLLKHQKMGRKVLIFYLGDYDPSGLEIQKDLERRMKNWSLTNFEIRRVGVTLDQINRLKLYQVVDPAKLKALANDSRGPGFEWEHGRRFAVEVDTMASGKGLKELKRLIKRIFDGFFDQRTWNKYKDVFTVDKVHKRLVAAFVPYALTAIDDKNQSIEDFASSLKSEEEELLEIEGTDYRQPLDESHIEEEEEDEEGKNNV